MCFNLTLGGGTSYVTHIMLVFRSAVQCDFPFEGDSGGVLSRGREPSTLNFLRAELLNLLLEGFPLFLYLPGFQVSGLKEFKRFQGARDLGFGP